MKPRPPAVGWPPATNNERPKRVSLITEGTYPFVVGGVSTWCDQLVRSLDEIDFVLYAITDGVPQEPQFELPGNVVKTVRVPLVGPPGLSRKIPGVDVVTFLRAWEHMVDALLAPPDLTSRRFLDALRGLFDVRHLVPIASGVACKWAFEVLYEKWNTANIDPRSENPPTLSDVLEALNNLAVLLGTLDIDPEPVDIVHSTANGLSALVAMATKWSLEVPFILTEHGIYLRERYLAGHGSELSHNVKTLLLRFFLHVNTAAFQVADLVTPVSDYNKRWEIRTGARPESIRTVHNGIDPGLFPELTSEPDVPTVSWIGRIDPLKDVETLLRGFAVAHKAMPEARLLMFGPVPEGNERYHQKCLDLAESLGIAERATFEGRTSAVSEAHAAGNVVALSSISEGFPYTVIEAMASGRATVSTDVGGVSEAVADTGLLVPARDPDAFGAALLELLGDPDRRAEMGRNARKRALEFFTLDQLIETYREIYSTVSIYEEAEMAAPFGTLERRPETKLRDVAMAWLDSNPAKRPSSIARDQSALRVHILPALGGQTIESLMPADIQRCVNDWSQRMAPRSTRRVYGTLTAILNHAVLHDLIASSPCQGITLPAVESLERRVVSADELQAVAEALGPEYGAMAYLATLLGLRWGECAGLRIGRIDFRSSSITVAEQITRGVRGRSLPGPLKSEPEQRTLAVPVPLMQILAYQIERQGIPEGDVEAFVFTTPDGKHLEYSNWLRRIWYPARERAGLEWLNFQDLRRTNATGLVLDSTTLEITQTRLGRIAPHLTLATFTQATTEAERTAADRLSESSLRSA